MYEAFYGLDKKPFSMLPDPDFLFLSKKHQAALTLLEYGMLNHAVFCVISGEPGAGKTTIIRAMLKNVSDDVTVGLITNTHRSFGGLLDWILSAFDLHKPNLTQVEMHQVFMDFVINEYANNRSVLLIVDEAQNMTADALEELRMLSNVNSEKDQLMQIILAGQPELKQMLAAPELMQFAQRVAVDYHLDALSLEETCGYIQHRLRIAGAKKDVFTPAACERIHNYSGGTPRLINLLCETAMVYGFADQTELIDVDLVDEMVQERLQDSIVPIVNRNMARQGVTAACSISDDDFPWISPRDDGEGEQEPQSETATGVESHAKEEAIEEAIEEEIIPVVDDIIEEPVKAQPQIDSYTSESGGSIDASELEKAEKVIEEYSMHAVENETPKPEPGTGNSQYTQANEKYDEVANADTGVFPNNRVVSNRSASRSSLVKYVVISVVLGIILIAAAIVFDFGNKLKLDNIKKQFTELQMPASMQSDQVQIDADRAVAEAEAAVKVKQAAEAEAANAKAAAEAELVRAKAEAEAAIARAKAEAEAELARARAEAEKIRAAALAANQAANQTAAQAASDAASANAATEAEMSRAKAEAEVAIARAKAEAEAELARAKAEAERIRAAAEAANEAARAKAIADAEAAAKAMAEAETARAKAAAEAEAAVQAKVKADLLRQQREAALAKIQEEKRLKEKAEKLATARAEKAAAEAKRKRIAERQRIAQAQRRVKLDAEKAAELERQRLVEQARLERQKRLEKEAEARRLEREWYEQQRQALLEAEAAHSLRVSGNTLDTSPE